MLLPYITAASASEEATSWRLYTSQRWTTDMVRTCMVCRAETRSTWRRETPVCLISEQVEQATKCRLLHMPGRTSGKSNQLRWVTNDVSRASMWALPVPLASGNKIIRCFAVNFNVNAYYQLRKHLPRNLPRIKACMNIRNIKSEWNTSIVIGSHSILQINIRHLTCSVLAA